AAGGDRPRDGAGLGGEPRLANLRDRPAVHRLPAGLCRPEHRPLLGLSRRPAGGHASGAAFVFRGPGVGRRGASPWGRVFGVASVITPVLLGTAVGAVSAGTL